MNTVTVTNKPNINKKVKYNKKTSNHNSKQHINMPQKAEKGFKIFVGGIPQDSEKEEILTYFKVFGKVLNVEIPMNKKKNSIKGFAFVTFEIKDSLEMAIALKSPSIRNKKIAIRAALNEKEAQNETERVQNLKLFVRGFPLDAKEHEIFDFFNQISQVDRVLIVQNAKLQKFRGFAYIVLKSQQAYETALAKSEGLLFRGNQLSVSESKSKDQVDKEKRSSQENSHKKKSARNSEVTDDTVAKFSSTDSTGVLEEREFLNMHETPLQNKNPHITRLNSPNKKRHSLSRQSVSFNPYNNISGSQRVINSQDYSPEQPIQKKSYFCYNSSSNKLDMQRPRLQSLNIVQSIQEIQGKDQTRNTQNGLFGCLRSESRGYQLYQSDLVTSDEFLARRSIFYSLMDEKQ